MVNETTLNDLEDALHEHCRRAEHDDTVRERGIDIIIDGKTHTVFPPYDRDDNVSDGDQDEYHSDFRFFMNSSRNGVFMIIK